MDRAVEEKAEVKSLKKEQLWAEESQRSQGGKTEVEYLMGIPAGCPRLDRKVTKELFSLSVIHPPV